MCVQTCDHDCFPCHPESSPVCSLQCGDASGTGLFDTANRTYDTKRMETIDKSLPDFFPELIGPNEVAFCSPSPFCNVGFSSVCRLQREGFRPSWPGQDCGMVTSSALFAVCVKG